MGLHDPPSHESLDSAVTPFWETFGVFSWCGRTDFLKTTFLLLSSVPSLTPRSPHPLFHRIPSLSSLAEMAVSGEERRCRGALGSQVPTRLSWRTTEPRSKLPSVYQDSGQLTARWWDHVTIFVMKKHFLKIGFKFNWLVWLFRYFARSWAEVYYPFRVYNKFELRAKLKCY